MYIWALLSGSIKRTLVLKLVKKKKKKRILIIIMIIGLNSLNLRI